MNISPSVLLIFLVALLLFAVAIVVLRADQARRTRVKPAATAESEPAAEQPRDTAGEPAGAAPDAAIEDGAAEGATATAQPGRDVDADHEDDTVAADPAPSEAQPAVEDLPAVTVDREQEPEHHAAAAEFSPTADTPPFFRDDTPAVPAEPEHTAAFRAADLVELEDSDGQGSDDNDAPAATEPPQDAPDEAAAFPQSAEHTPDNDEALHFLDKSVRSPEPVPGEDFSDEVAEWLAGEAQDMDDQRHAARQQRTAAEQPTAAVTDDHETTPTPASADEPVTAAALPPEREPKRHFLSGLFGGGTGDGRRARRAFAEAHGLEFQRSDTFLANELSTFPHRRNDMTDVVSGFIHGRETHLGELGAATILLLRRDLASSHVVALVRAGAPELGRDLTDLHAPDADFGTFGMQCDDTDVGARLVDTRLVSLLERLPDGVDAVWAEGTWAGARFAERPTMPDVQAVIGPLAQFADCLRVLPPAAHSDQDIAELTAFPDVQRDPTRPMVHSPEQADTGLARTPRRDYLQAVPVAAEVDDPAVEQPWRPPRPAQRSSTPLPSRRVSRREGETPMTIAQVTAEGDLTAIGQDGRTAQPTNPRGPRPE